MRRMSFWPTRSDSRQPEKRIAPPSGWQIACCTAEFRGSGPPGLGLLGVITQMPPECSHVSFRQLRTNAPYVLCCFVPISYILHRRKIANLFRRQTTAKSVTDLPIGAWYRFGHCSRHDPIRDRKTFDAISPDIRPPFGHFPADSAPPVISSQVMSARSSTGRTSWFKRYRCCTSFAAASVTRA